MECLDIFSSEFDGGFSFSGLGFSISVSAGSGSVLVFPRPGSPVSDSSWLDPSGTGEIDGESKAISSGPDASNN